MADYVGEPASRDSDRDSGREGQAGRPLVLTGPGAGSGTLRINHRWDILPPERARRSLLRKLFPPMNIETDAPIFQPIIDLDLGCFYELTNGTRGVVQGKGNQRGEFGRPPYISHGTDDKYGSAAGENLFINLDYVNRIRRVLIYVYRYPLVIGSSSALNPAHGTVTFYATVGGPIEVELAFAQPSVRTCAVALLGHAADGRLLARRDLRYVGGYQDELDMLYSWGLPPGSIQFPAP